MNKAIVLLLVFILSSVCVYADYNSCRVNGYFRRDGTYVAPYTRKSCVRKQAANAIYEILTTQNERRKIERRNYSYTPYIPNGNDKIFTPQN